MRPRHLFTAAAVIAATMLPVEAAHAATSCFGRNADYVGTSNADYVTVFNLRRTVHTRAGNDTVRVDYGNDQAAWVCLGDGDDNIDAVVDPGRGAIVGKLDGGGGKDRAVVQACFGEPWDTQKIEVRDVERLVIVPCDWAGDEH